MRKKFYEKPEIKKIELSPEEAVLASCKRTAAIGRGRRKCKIPICRVNKAGS